MERIPTLDGWRAIAITLVIAAHAGSGIAGLTEKDYFTASVARFGFNGVPIFFGLSGLLICKLLLSEFDAAGTISLWSFYSRRAFRILPPLAILIATLGALGFIRSGWELASCLAFFRNYVPAEIAGVYTNHIWSLSIEEHFYLVWPALLLLLLRGRHPLAMTVAAASAIGVWRSFDMHLHLTRNLAPVLDSNWRTDYRLDSLLWGCVAALLLHRSGSREFLERNFSGLMLCAVIGAFCSMQVISVPLGAVWAAMAIPLMLLGTVTHPGWLFSRMLTLPGIQWIGRISYSLYLWQQVFLVPAWDVHPFPVLQRLPWNIAACVGCATLSYYLVEKPMIRMGRKMIAARDFSQPIAKRADRELAASTSGAN